MAIVVKSEFWGPNYSLITERNGLSETVARLFNKPGMRRNRALINALLGVAPGATATVNDVRIQANTQELGGKRVIETVQPLNRATTAGDVTALKAALINLDKVGAGYPIDAAKRA